MTTANARTTKLQTQFEPNTTVTIFTHDKDDKANVIIVKNVVGINHTAQGFQLITGSQETVFVLWSHTKYFLTGVENASVQFQ